MTNLKVTIQEGGKTAKEVNAIKMPPKNIDGNGDVFTKLPY